MNDVDRGRGGWTRGVVFRCFFWFAVFLGTSLVGSAVKADFGTPAIYGAWGMPGASSFRVQPFLSLDLLNISPGVSDYWQANRFHLNIYGKIHFDRFPVEQFTVKRYPNEGLPDRRYPSLASFKPADDVISKVVLPVSHRNGLSARILTLASEAGGYGDVTVFREVLYSAIARVPFAMQSLWAAFGPLSVGYWGSPEQPSYLPNGIDSYRLTEVKGKLPSQTGQNSLVPLGSINQMVKPKKEMIIESVAPQAGLAIPAK